MAKSTICERTAITTAESTPQTIRSGGTICPPEVAVLHHPPQRQSRYLHRLSLLRGTERRATRNPPRFPMRIARTHSSHWLAQHRHNRRIVWFLVRPGDCTGRRRFIDWPSRRRSCWPRQIVRCRLTTWCARRLGLAIGNMLLTLHLLNGRTSSAGCVCPTRNSTREPGDGGNKYRVKSGGRRLAPVTDFSIAAAGLVLHSSNYWLSWPSLAFYWRCSCPQCKRHAKRRAVPNVSTI